MVCLCRCACEGESSPLHVHIDVCMSMLRICVHIHIHASTLTYVNSKLLWRIYTPATTTTPMAAMTPTKTTTTTSRHYFRVRFWICTHMSLLIPGRFTLSICRTCHVRQRCLCMFGWPWCLFSACGPNVVLPVYSRSARWRRRRTDMGTFGGQRFAC